VAKALHPGRGVQSLPPGPYWFVDDEPELVDATVRLLAREVGAANVRGASDPREVLGWIDAARPTALITDVRMPHVTGLELVTRLHERWGSVPVVVMTAFPTAQVDRDARAGRFAYLPKPFGFHVLRDTLARICAQPAPSAFSGAIAVSMLGEVVQLYGLANRTGVLRVSSPHGVGDIAFDSGQVVDAHTATQVGVDAFNTVLGWTSGSFLWLNTPPQQVTIHQGLSELLLEAYRLRDEATAGRVESPPVDEADPFAALDALDPAPIATSPNLTPLPRANNVAGNLSRLETVSGFLGAAIYDIDAQVCLAALDTDTRAQVTAAVGHHADMVLAKRRTLSNLKLDDEIEDIVISLGREYHLLRLCRRQPQLFFFLSLDRSKANLAMARYVLSDVERDMVL